MRTNKSNARPTFRSPIRIEQLENRNLLTLFGLSSIGALATEPEPLFDSGDESVSLEANVAVELPIVQESLETAGLPLLPDLPEQPISSESGGLLNDNELLPELSVGDTLAQLTEVETLSPELPLGDTLPQLTEAQTLLSAATPAVELDVGVEILNVVEADVELISDIGEQLDVGMEVETAALSLDAQIQVDDPVTVLDSGLQLEVDARVDAPLISDNLLGPVHAELDVSTLGDELVEVDTSVDVGIEILNAEMEIEIPSVGGEELELPLLPDLAIPLPNPDFSTPIIFDIEITSEGNIDANVSVGNETSDVPQLDVVTETVFGAEFAGLSRNETYEYVYNARDAHHTVPTADQPARYGSIVVQASDASTDQLNFFLVIGGTQRFVNPAEFERAVGHRESTETENRQESREHVNPLDLVFAEEPEQLKDDAKGEVRDEKVQIPAVFWDVDYLPENFDAVADDITPGQEMLAFLIAAPVGVAAAIRAFEEFLEKIKKAQQQLMHWLARFGTLPWILMSLAVAAALYQLVRWRKEWLKRRFEASIDWAMI